jgi:SAM-dependent methyltransferase
MSFNRSAAAYRLARPSYPPEVYEILATRCGLGPGTRVVEIGAGTGQATVELLARGASVVAVEPGASLAAHLSSDHGGPNLSVVTADFEHASLPSGAFDLAVSATAFHWVRREVALPRLASILRPGGWLAVWWTVFGDPIRVTPFRSALSELYRKRLPRSWHHPSIVPGPLNTPSWTAELMLGGHFDEAAVDVIRWEHPLTTEGARRLFGSFPNVMELPDRKRNAFLDAIAALVDAHGGEVLDPYATVVYTTQPRPRRESNPL